jgi:hypothetical protein
MFFYFFEETLTNKPGHCIFDTFIDFAHVGLPNILNLNIDLLVGGIEAGVELTIIPEILRVSVNILNLRLQGVRELANKVITDILNNLQLFLNVLFFDVSILEDII